jgi:RHS repeat-associated protein
MVALTDDTGVPVRNVAYGIWGDIRTNEAPDPSATPDPGEKFTGQRFDKTTGLYYYGARYYDPNIGRFTQPDAIIAAVGDPQSFNLYAYVRNDPLNRIDPSGNVNLSFQAGDDSSDDWLFDVYDDPAWYLDVPWYLDATLEHTDSFSEVDFSSTGQLWESWTDPFYGVEQMNWSRSPVSLSQGGGSIGAPGFAESLIPVWGSGRAAVSDLQEGRYGWASFNTAVAVSDVFLVGALTKGAAKGAFKLGSHTWSATRKWYGQTRSLERGTPVHHWLIERNSAIGKQVPDAIKNQPWNLMPMRSQALHNQVHGWNPDGFNAAGQLWYGTPPWTKAGAFSTTGHGVEAYWGP